MICKSRENYSQLTIYPSKELGEKIEEYSKRYGKKQSTFICMLLEMVLSDEEILVRFENELD